MPETNYLLGHSAHEIRRLELQSRVFAPGTDRILYAAGLRPGMSVLDIGTGAGDVAMQAARVVGPTGSVLGIDREASVLERARSRAETAELDRIRYEAATFDTLPAMRSHDFVVGRYVLFFQPDRAAFLRQAAGLVRSGGTLLFIEPGLPELDTFDAQLDARYSDPPVALFEEMCRHILLGFRLGGTRPRTGAALVEQFHEAGLPEPDILHEVPSGGPNSLIVEWLVLTLRSVLPALEKHGVTTADRIGIDTLQARIQAAVSVAHSQVRGANLVGAWVTVV